MVNSQPKVRPPASPHIRLTSPVQDIGNVLSDILYPP